MWANTISDALNGPLLPPEYFSEIRVQVGRRQALDFETPAQVEPSLMVMPAFFPDSVQVLVFNGEGGNTLVAAVETRTGLRPDRHLLPSASCIYGRAGASSRLTSQRAAEVTYTMTSSNYWEPEVSSSCRTTVCAPPRTERHVVK